MLKYGWAIALLNMHYSAEREHIEKLKKRKRKGKSVKERIAESEWELPDLFSAIQVLLKERKSGN